MQLRSKKQAAEFLGISTRAVERAVRRGHLVAQYRPSKHGRMAWFGSEDLARYRNFQQVRAPLGFSSAFAKAPHEGAFTIGTVTPITPAEREVTPSQSDSSKNFVPLNQRLMLSVAEALRLSGLPRQFLVSSIQSKKLKSVKIGRSTFVKRSDLEAFVKGL